MSEGNKALVRHWFEESDRVGRAPDELFAPGFVAHIAGSPDMDASAFQQYIASFYNAFTDFSHCAASVEGQAKVAQFLTRSRF